MKILSKITIINILFFVIFNAQAASVTYDAGGGTATTKYISGDSGSYTETKGGKKTEIDYDTFTTTPGGEEVTVSGEKYKIDNLLARANANSGHENQFMSAVLPDIELVFSEQVNIEDINSAVFNGAFIKDSSTGVSILSLTKLNIFETSGYFMLKFANKNSGIHSHYIFENLTSLSNLVWLTSISKKQEDVFLGLSHFVLASNSTTTVNNVPLPAAVWLFGSAFLGLMGVARKRTKVA